jgi:enterochelin esterase family protein
LYVPLLWLFNERASHSAGITLLQMQIVINNIINKICSETKKTVKHEVIRVTALTTGSEAWWQSKNGPEWNVGRRTIASRSGGVIRQERRRTSPIKRVWLYVTGVTDHHQNARPQSLERIPGYRRLAVAGRVQPRVARKLLFYPFRE